MSGDVQPRKRREKKKKKEDGPEEVVFQHQQQATTSPSVTDDLNIHIQKESSTGGGLCAKFVFFILLTALTTLIALIITEHRGLTDLNTIDTESRFAQLFDGWTDSPSVDHDESPEELSIEQSEEHHYEDEEGEEGEEEDEDATQEEDRDHEEDEEDVSNLIDTNESEEEYDEEEKEESNVQDEETAENDSEEVSNENDDEVDEYVEENEDNDEQDEDDQEEEPENASEDEEKYDVSAEEQDDASVLTKEDVTQEDESYKEDKDDEEDSEETVDKAPERLRYRVEPVKRRFQAEPQRSRFRVEPEKTRFRVEPERRRYRAVSEEVVDLTESEEAADQVVSDEIPSSDDVADDTVEKSDEDTIEKADDEDAAPIIESEPKETVAKVRPKKRSEPENIKIEEEIIESTDQPQENENYNMVIKFGVGTALLVVAHVVLVQKWRTAKVTDTKPQVAAAEEVESVSPDLSRRNTIVTPPNLQDIEQDIENVEEEYSEDEDESDDDSKSKPAGARKRYQELQSTYSHTLTPDWEPKEVRENRNKESEEEDEEDEDEELEGDEEYDDEISENEDEELLQRLEAKYGKINRNDGEPENNEEDEEDEDEEELEDDRDEDFDSWKRVKVPSDDVPDDSDSDSEKNWPKQHTGAQTLYDFANITNAEDLKEREELYRAQQNLANDAAYALTLFNKILERNPSSPRALYGKAQSLDKLAEERKSNKLLQQAIMIYQEVLKTRDVPDVLFQIAADRCIDRIRFKGVYGQAVPIHSLLIERFPEEVKFRNHLAVTYLTMSKINEARKVLHDILLKWPNDGFALVHYGFILKTSDNDIERAVDFLKRGIATKEPGVIDGRFYFHLGDAFTRLGKNKEAMKTYLDGVKNKVFLSKYQRSLYNIKRLTGKPWWGKNNIPQHHRFFEELENNWTIIRGEGLSILNKKGFFQPESENLRDVGDWKQFELYARGIKNIKNCEQCPITCKIIETFPDAVGCRRGQIKFSVMHPGTHVWPHCGPTNCRLRIHLGLKVPLNTYIRVGAEIRSWKEGKLLIFDDSFEHEVWHNGTVTRLVLIVDIWHPELTKQEKRSLSSI